MRELQCSVGRWALLAAAVLVCVVGGGPALGGTPPPGAPLLGSDQAVLPLLDRDDCAPTEDAPCPTTGNAGATQGSATMDLLAVGTTAKPFTLNDPKGNPLGFDTEPGEHPFLLVFWSLFCEPCKEELPFLDAMVREYQDQGLQGLTVNIDGENMAKAAARYWQMNRFVLPVAMDRKDGKTYQAADSYGVTGTPSIFLFGRDRVVRWNHAGRLDPQVFRAEIERLYEP